MGFVILSVKGPVLREGKYAPRSDWIGAFHFFMFFLRRSRLTQRRRRAQLSEALNSGGSRPPPSVTDKGGLLTGRNREYHDALQASETTMFLTAAA